MTTFESFNGLAILEQDTGRQGVHLKDEEGAGEGRRTGSRVEWESENGCEYGEEP